MRPPKLPQVVAQLRHAATARTFGCPDEERRAAIEHGYLLALEEIEREMRLKARATNAA
jgi:hypothetical protein